MSEKQSFLDQIKGKYDSLSENDKKKSKVGLILAFVLLFLLSAYICGLPYTFAANLNGKSKFPIYYGIKDNLLMTIFCAVAFCVLFYALASKTPKFTLKNSIKSVTNDGLALAKNGPYGNSSLANEDELRQTYNVCDVKDTYENIYGQTMDSENGEKVVAHKAPDYGGIDEQNVLLVGSPGTGKSYAYVRTAIMQAVLRGNSVVVTDPSGELYTSHANWCKNKGIPTYQLNLEQTKYSDCWNCVDEIFDRETERLDSVRLDTFIRTFYDNTTNGKESSEFWTDSALNVFKIVVGTLAWRRESFMLACYKKLFTKIAAGDDDYDEMFEEFSDPMISFAEVKRVIRIEAQKHNYDQTEIEETLEKIKKDAPSCTFGDAFFYTFHFDELTQYLKTAPTDHPCQIAYQSFLSAGKPELMGQFLQNIQNRMTIFSDRNVRALCSNDGIDLHQVTARQTVVFVSPPTTKDTLKPIASLFFTFLITDCVEEYDKAEGRLKEGEKNPRIPISIILDELASIGTIGGTTANGIQLLPHTLAVSRKDRLEFSIILQDIGQLDTNYLESGARSIVNCCNYIIYLGAKDPKTLEFISDLSGDATAITESHQEANDGIIPTGGLLGNSGGTMNVSAVKTVLRTPDQVRRKEERTEYLFGKNQKMAQLRVFPWIKHPCYLNHELTNADVTKDYLPISIRIKRGLLPADIYTLDAENHGYRPDYLTAATSINNKINSLRPIGEEDPLTTENDEDVVAIDDSEDSNSESDDDIEITSINESEKSESEDKAEQIGINQVKKRSDNTEKKKEELEKTAQISFTDIQNLYQNITSPTKTTTDNERTKNICASKHKKNTRKRSTTSKKKTNKVDSDLDI